MQILAVVAGVCLLLFNIYCIWRWFDFMASVESAQHATNKNLERLITATEGVVGRLEAASKLNAAQMRDLMKLIDSGE